MHCPFSVYHTRELGDALVHELANKVICEMVKQKMNVAGRYCIMIRELNL